MNLSRRESLGLIGASGAMLVGADALDAQTPAANGIPALAGKHEVVALPYDPKSLKGISERLIVSHHDNNYGGAVKNLNKVELELARVDASTAPFVVGGLQQSALQYGNSMRLHELYFANLGGDGKASGAIESALTGAYGSLARWEEYFRATGASLGGGSGWAVLTYDFHAGAVHTFWSGNHTMAHACGAPLLVMDMYEHAYQMDYGAAAAKYIDAFFGNIRWDEVNRRLERAQKASAALRG